VSQLQLLASSVGYAGGGGGGGNTTGGTATSGGGAGVNSGDANSGTANTGGGGGGCVTDAGAGTPLAGNGGSGVVILRYSDGLALADINHRSPTQTTTGGYTFILLLVAEALLSDAFDNRGLRVGTALSAWGFPTGDGPPTPTAVDYLLSLLAVVVLALRSL
jgi:hypothetical protein